MNNLKCLKQKFNNRFECKRTGKEIKLSDCKGCPYREYKCTVFQNNYAKLKTKSNKLAKLERERASLFTDDLEHCIICGKSPVNLHEIFGGRNRLNSIKYKLVIPLCTCEHHGQVNCTGIHFDKELRKEWQIKGQVVFEQTYPDLDFMEIFGRNYH